MVRRSFSSVLSVTPTTLLRTFCCTLMTSRSTAKWYENADPKQEVFEFRTLLKDLDTTDRQELVNQLSCDPRHFHALTSTNTKVQRILAYYIPKPKHELLKIWNQKTEHRQEVQSAWVSEEERVEDAELRIRISSP